MSKIPISIVLVGMCLFDLCFYVNVHISDASPLLFKLLPQRKSYFVSLKIDLRQQSINSKKNFVTKLCLIIRFMTLLKEMTYENDTDQIRYY